jgi:ABC-type Zn uptake system ZnuABC Zn-binding protein ZnuA
MKLAINRRVMLGFAAAGICMPGCSSMEDPWKGVGGSPKVLVTFPPLYSMVKQVGGDGVAVLCLCTTTGPHHYTYNARDAILLRNADLFFSVGLGLDDHFVDKMLAADSGKTVRHAALGKLLVPHNLCLASPEEEHDHSGHDHDHHHHGEHDPHVWLGTRQCKAMAVDIARYLGEQDPANRDRYHANAKAFGERMDALKKQGRDQLAAKKENRLISFHPSLAYLADTFALQIADTIQINPGAEPDGKRLAKLIAKCVEEKIRVLAVEPQYPTTTASKLILEELKRKGIDAKMVEIDPLETAEPSELAAGWFEKKMQENLKALVETLP